jgi:antitoxin Phd
MVAAVDQRTPRTSWTIQDARNHFSEVVSAARHEPQTVTRHGRNTVVVVSADEYARLKKVEVSKKPSFAEALLSIPQAPPDEDPNEEIFPRMRIKFRDIDL